jgi:hypothetical protein
MSGTHGNDDIGQVCTCHTICNVGGHLTFSPLANSFVGFYQFFRPQNSSMRRRWGSRLDAREYS